MLALETKGGKRNSQAQVQTHYWMQRDLAPTHLRIDISLWMVLRPPTSVGQGNQVLPNQVALGSECQFARSVQNGSEIKVNQGDMWVTCAVDLSLLLIQHLDGDPTQNDYDLHTHHSSCMHQQAKQTKNKIGGSCPWNGSSLVEVDTEMQRDGETEWWQSGKGIMTKGMENADMDCRSMPTAFLHFNLLSLSCFPASSSGRSPWWAIWLYWSNICKTFLGISDSPICGGSCGALSFEGKD